MDQPIASTQSLVLDLPPSCIEFCPAYPEFFVVGTYNLQKDTEPTEENDGEDGAPARQPQSRNGSLILFHLESHTVRQIQTLLQPSAILDLHFHPQKSKQNVLAVVSSTGTLAFVKLSPSLENPTTYHLSELACHRPLGDDEGTLILSCCWHPNIPDLIAVTTSTFEVHVLRVDDAWNISETGSNPILTHTLEAWTVAFSSVPPLNSSVGQNGGNLFTIFSGGDDSKLLQTACLYQPENGGDGDWVENLTPPITIRGHQAGVTAILPLDIEIDGGYIMLTGSYDDHIRGYLIHQQGQRPQLLAETNLGGGVWRLKLIKTVRKPSGHWEVTVLASCMHAGSRILRVSGDSQPIDAQIQVLGRFEEHKSMNYGSDFEPGSEAGGKPLQCISTSFYDKLLCLWEFGK
ncbi:hypothetical protein BX600DRAFT_477734 [Xylariales sp. PMI_506]|nr:hypothetical protein BX600DRAFT_477734 [Xylariales sp. PMI_506]